MAGEPARGYSWPQFKKGNSLAMKHGAFSERKVNPQAQEIAAGLVAERPDLEEFPEIVWAWACATIQWLLLEEHFTEGIIGEGGKLKPGAEFLTRFRKHSIELGARLGLDPKSQAELAKERAGASREAFDLQRLQDKGQKILEQRSRDA